MGPECAGYGRYPAGCASDDFYPGNGLAQRLLQLALQRAVVDRAGQRQLGGEPQPGDPGNILGACAAAAFLPPTLQQRRRVHARTQHQRANALRPAELVSAEAQIIHAQRPHGQRQLTRGLHGVGVHAPARGLGHPRDLRHGLHGAGLVVDEHERNQPRLSGVQPFLECRHIRQPFGSHGKGLQPGDAIEHGIVLDG